MRITLVHYSFLPVIGGVEIVVAEHARLFADHGHQVTLLGRRGASQDPRIRFRELPGGAAPSQEDALREALWDQDVVIVHNVLTMPFEPAWTAILWRLADELAEVRFVAWIHDLAVGNPDYPGPLPLLLGQAHPRMTHVAISAHRKAQFEALTGRNCALIPNGLHPGELDLSPSVNTLAEKSGFFAEGWALLHPARLLRRKNIELSLRVTAALREAGHPAFLLLTAPPDPHNPGSENYARELRTLRSDLGVEARAFFLHDHFPLDARDLRSLYRIADALFFPSHQEGFGLPLLEAALHGKPVFCPGIEPLKTLGATFAHFFSPEATPEQVAAQIAGVLQGSREINARKSVLRDYAWAAIYEKFLAPLLLKKPSSHPE